MATRTAFSGALCGEALEFLGLFRKEVPSGVWGGASKSSPSLRSVRRLGMGRGFTWSRSPVSPSSVAGATPCVRVPGGWNALCGRVGTTEIPPAGAPSGGRGSLCGVVWLSRSPLHPVCRFAQDDTWGAGAWDEKQNAVSVRKVKCRINQFDCTIFCTKQISNFTI